MEDETWPLHWEADSLSRTSAMTQDLVDAGGGHRAGPALLTLQLEVPLAELIYEHSRLVMLTWKKHKPTFKTCF